MIWTAFGHNKLQVHSRVCMYAKLEQKSIKIDLIKHLLSIAICFWRRFRKKRFLALAGLIESMLGHMYYA